MTKHAEQLEMFPDPPAPAATPPATSNSPEIPEGSDVPKRRSRMRFLPLDYPDRPRARRMSGAA
jgi:hypothetical protein